MLRASLIRTINENGCELAYRGFMVLRGFVEVPMALDAI